MSLMRISADDRSKGSTHKEVSNQFTGDIIQQHWCQKYYVTWTEVETGFKITLTTTPYTKTEEVVISMLATSNTHPYLLAGWPCCLLRDSVRLHSWSLYHIKPYCEDKMYNLWQICKPQSSLGGKRLIHIKEAFIFLKYRNRTTTH